MNHTHTHTHTHEFAALLRKFWLRSTFEVPQKPSSLWPHLLIEGSGAEGLGFRVLISFNQSICEAILTVPKSSIHSRRRQSINGVKAERCQGTAACSFGMLQILCRHRDVLAEGISLGTVASTEPLKRGVPYGLFPPELIATHDVCHTLARVVGKVAAMKWHHEPEWFSDGVSRTVPSGFLVAREPSNTFVRTSAWRPGQPRLGFRASGILQLGLQGLSLGLVRV